MPFVRSTDHVKRLQGILRNPTFTGMRTIMATFTTDPGFIADLLPPPLEPSEPLARVWVGDIATSNVAGAFAGAGLDIAAQHDGRHGWYSLFMPMNTDSAVQVGRETLGEPKKLCDIRLEEGGATVRGTVARRGVTLMTLEVAPEAELGPMQEDALMFHYKYLLSCCGDGYDAPPKLIHALHHIDAAHAAAGSATLTLASTPHDTLGDLPVLEMGQGLYMEGGNVVEARAVCDVDGDAFLPWAYANADDWLVFAEVQKRAAALGPHAATHHAGA